MITYEYLTGDTLRSDDVSDINQLLAQLTASAQPLSRRWLRHIARKSFLLVARNEEGHIVGMSTLCPLATPTGSVGFVEDVVAFESVRGQGVGKELVGRLIQKAKDEKMDRVELTCKPSRTAANALYARLGFERRETNNWILRLPK